MQSLPPKVSHDWLIESRVYTATPILMQQSAPPPPPPLELEQDDNYDLHPEEPIAEENYDLHPTDDQFEQDQTYEMPPAELVSESNSIHKQKLCYI